MRRRVWVATAVLLFVGLTFSAAPASARDHPVLFENTGSIRYGDPWAGVECYDASAFLTVHADARLATYSLQFPSHCASAQAHYLQMVGTAGVAFVHVFGSWEEGWTGISGAHVLTIHPRGDGTLQVWGSYFWPLPEPAHGGGVLREARLR